MNLALVSSVTLAGKMDVHLGGFNFKYFSVCFLVPQGLNWTWFGRHDSDTNARERDVKRTPAVSAYGRVALEGRRFSETKINFTLTRISLQR
jgi:hypothetical protein